TSMPSSWFNEVWTNSAAIGPELTWNPPKVTRMGWPPLSATISSSSAWAAAGSDAGMSPSGEYHGESTEVKFVAASEPGERMSASTGMSRARATTWRNRGSENGSRDELKRMAWPELTLTVVSTPPASTLWLRKSSVMPWWMSASPV